MTSNINNHNNTTANSTFHSGSNPYSNSPTTASVSSNQTPSLAIDIAMVNTHQPGNGSSSIDNAHPISASSSSTTTATNPTIPTTAMNMNTNSNNNNAAALVNRQRKKSHSTHSPYSSPRERRRSSLNVSPITKSPITPNRVGLFDASFSEPPQTFIPYHSSYNLSKNTSSKIPLIDKMKLHILEVYKNADPEFRYISDSNPRRVLTKPSKPAHNNGYDNEDYDYILYVNDILGERENQRYQIMDLLGQGTFGQVVKCKNLYTNEFIAVKVIKNKPAYFNQSKIEVTLLDQLNKSNDPNDRHHIVRMKDTFIFRNHLCIVFEMLSVNLYELIKQNSFKGLSTNLVRVFVSQILDCLRVLNAANVIHCDLKPENILLKNLDSPSIKVIDFGSACYNNETIYTYIQSRFYRSPEVLLGLPYNTAIDMWSLGCIAAELFLGLPLFPGTSEYNQVSRIVEILGVPDIEICERGKSTKNFFKKAKYPDGHVKYTLKTLEEYSFECNANEQPSKKYFRGNTLDELVLKYPISSRKTPAEVERGELKMIHRHAFLDFLKGILNLDSNQRWTPDQALRHPFIRGEPLTAPFNPHEPFRSPNAHPLDRRQQQGYGPGNHPYNQMQVYNDQGRLSISDEGQKESILQNVYGGSYHTSGQSSRVHSHKPLMQQMDPFPIPINDNPQMDPSMYAISQQSGIHQGYGGSIPPQAYGSGQISNYTASQHRDSYDKAQQEGPPDRMRQMVGNFADFNIDPSLQDSQPTSSPYGGYLWNSDPPASGASSRRGSIPNRENFNNLMEVHHRRAYGAPMQLPDSRRPSHAYDYAAYAGESGSNQSVNSQSSHPGESLSNSSSKRDLALLSALKHSAAKRRISAPDVNPATGDPGFVNPTGVVPTGIPHFDRRMGHQKSYSWVHPSTLGQPGYAPVNQQQQHPGIVNSNMLSPQQQPYKNQSFDSMPNIYIQNYPPNNNPMSSRGGYGPVSAPLHPQYYTVLPDPQQQLLEHPSLPQTVTSSSSISGQQSAYNSHHHRTSLSNTSLHNSSGYSSYGHNLHLPLSSITPAIFVPGVQTIKESEPTPTSGNSAISLEYKFPPDDSV